MPPAPAPRPLFAAALLLALAMAPGPAAGQAAGPSPASPGPTGAAAVDRLIDVSVALETAWQADRRCRLLPAPERRELDWLESALRAIMRETFPAETRLRLSGLARRMAEVPPFAGCGPEIRRQALGLMPEAAAIVATLNGRRYAGEESYRRLLADRYFQARAAFGADARCRGQPGQPAAEPHAAETLAHTAEALAALLGAARVARIQAEAAAAATEATCGLWLGQALADARAGLERLHDGLAREATPVSRP